MGFEGIEAKIQGENKKVNMKVTIPVEVLKRDNKRVLGGHMIKIYNTLTRKLEEFKPVKEGEVSMYVLWSYCV